ncbi:MAG: hypothetical protein IBJ00_05600 [Alphaproteobacteria bacterium]|nr:hypothetical protein [Alphaproteobacteria bacterium]
MHAKKISKIAAVAEWCLEAGSSSLEAPNSSQLIIQSPCIPYIPELGEKIGVYPAILLQQIHYWSQKGEGERKQGKLWVHNKYEAWAQQLRCSVSCIRKTVKKLHQEGLIETKAFRSKYGDTTKWYAVNYEMLKELGLTLTPEVSSLKEKAVYTSSQKLLPAVNENTPHKNSQHINEKKSKTFIQSKICTPPHVLQCDSPLNKISKIINNLSPTEVGSDYQNMISIWNEIVHQGSKTVKLTERRLKWLKRRFRLEFQSCIEKWKEYCSLIANNDFLMGMGKKGWKVTLDWAIIPHNIQKVLSNAYERLIRIKREGREDGNEKPFQLQAKIEAEKKNTERKRLEALKMIEDSSHPLFWKQVCKELLLQIGGSKFEEFIFPLDPKLEKSGNRNSLTLKASSSFLCSWLSREYSIRILRICEKLNLGVRWVDFVHIPSSHLIGYDHEVGHRKDLEDSEIYKEKQETIKQIESSRHPVFWKSVCKLLLSKLGVEKFKSWISQLTFQNKCHNSLILKVASQQSLIWLKRNFSESILECCQKLDPNIHYLEFTCK